MHGLRTKGLECVHKYLKEHIIITILLLDDFRHIHLPLSLGQDLSAYAMAYYQVTLLHHGA